jgi:hypothetical protein
MKKALAEARKAEVEHRPLRMDELRPKVQAFLSRNALAARLALPRMVLVLAAVCVYVWMDVWEEGQRLAPIDRSIDRSNGS